MGPTIEIVQATQDDARPIADIHLVARAEAMPYLTPLHTDDEMGDWFAGAVGAAPSAWWVAQDDGRVFGYMLIDGEDLDHLYIHPEAQGRGIGAALLQKARSLSPRRVALATFQRDARARAFYEKHCFRIVCFTDGQNEEAEPDVQSVWEASA